MAVSRCFRWTVLHELLAGHFRPEGRAAATWGKNLTFPIQQKVDGRRVAKGTGGRRKGMYTHDHNIGRIEQADQRSRIFHRLFSLGFLVSHKSPMITSQEDFQNTAGANFHKTERADFENNQNTISTPTSSLVKQKCSIAHWVSSLGPQQCNMKPQVLILYREEDMFCVENQTANLREGFVHFQPAIGSLDKTAYLPSVFSFARNHWWRDTSERARFEAHRETGRVFECRQTPW